MHLIKRAVRRGINLLGFEVRKAGYLAELERRAKSTERLPLILEYTDSSDRSAALGLLQSGVAQSQLGQILFVLMELGFRTDGFFVEFGATNGIELSNTYVLEKQYGWQGIVAEPAHRWYSDLRRSRSCTIDTRCVWANSGERLAFSETRIGALSTISRFAASDLHATARQRGVREYQVETVSLNDLLSDHGAPPVIDYLSVDTEGSECAILSAFDFDAYSVRVLTVEHNFMKQREEISQLLKSRGFIHRFPQHSQWDDWYVSSVV